MKNIPDKIYLQVDIDEDFDDDFNEISSTWASEKINDNDIEYVRVKNMFNRKNIKELDDEICELQTDLLCMIKAVKVAEKKIENLEKCIK